MNELRESLEIYPKPLSLFIPTAIAPTKSDCSYPSDITSQGPTLWIMISTCS